jgi:hypothetical protein
MKNYFVYINIEGRRFFPAQWEALGTTLAKNKAQAIRLVYDAAWGIDNEAHIISDGFLFQYVTGKCSLKAEIEQ